VGEKGADRDRLDPAEVRDTFRTFAQGRGRRPPVTTVWTVRLVLGVFVALAGFFVFLASFVIELFLLSVVTRPDQLLPIFIVPLLAVSAVITAVAVRAVVRRLRRTLGPVA
jgi:ABC-type thiamin/hydroxymethylpyrimidine transport system permease subunit